MQTCGWRKTVLLRNPALPGRAWPRNPDLNRYVLFGLNPSYLAAIGVLISYVFTAWTMERRECQHYGQGHWSLSIRSALRIERQQRMPVAFSITFIQSNARRLLAAVGLVANIWRSYDLFLEGWRRPKKAVESITRLPRRNCGGGASKPGLFTASEVQNTALPLHPSTTRP